MIELKNISYIVGEQGKEKVILNDVSCIFPDGKLTAITGKNGSGKSTLTKIVMGIITPTSGQIFFNGKDITKSSIDERARIGLNYAFQQPVEFRGITIKELIDIATGQENSIPKACEYLSKVGICAKEYINRDFDKTLSGGEKKRIELALALAKKGECCIFDEPEAGIDLWSFERLTSLFEKNKTYIVVSHHEKILTKADYILQLDNGKVKNYGKAKQVIKEMGNMSCSKIGGSNETR